MPFITQSNAAGIIRKIDKSKLNRLVGEIFNEKMKGLFQEDDLFNNSEREELLLYKQLFKEPQKFINTYYTQAKNNNDQYIEKPKAPAFHKNKDCPRLNADFDGYELPPQILSRGKVEVEKFRRWWVENIPDDGMTDRFALQLSAEWKINISEINVVHRPNSGNEIIDNKSIVNHDEKINLLLEDLHLRIKKSGKARKILIDEGYARKSFVRKINSYENKTRYSNDEFINVVKYFDEHFKRPLLSSLKFYYRIRYNGQVEFKSTFLETLGFKPCRECYENN